MCVYLFAPSRGQPLCSSLWINNSATLGKIKTFKSGPFNGNIPENFKEEILIYFIATETDKKSQKIHVDRLISLLGSETLRLYRSLKPQEHLESEDASETVSSILNILEVPTMQT